MLNVSFAHASAAPLSSMWVGWATGRSMPRGTADSAPPCLLFVCRVHWVVSPLFFSSHDFALFIAADFARHVLWVRQMIHMIQRARPPPSAGVLSFPPHNGKSRLYASLRPATLQAFNQHTPLIAALSASGTVESLGSASITSATPPIQNT